MAQYSKPQLEQLWAEVNPGTGNPHLMAAIAMAESSGNSGAVNSIGACGLWQIHPYEAGCINPVTNARMAGEKLRGQGLGAWETYTNGSYSQYLTGTSTATGGRENASFIEELLEKVGLHAAGPLGEALENKKIGEKIFKGTESHIPGLGEPIGGINSLEALGKILTLLGSRDGWIRIGKVLIGLFLLLVGILGMANVSGPNVKPVATASKVTKKTLITAGLVGA